MNKITGNGVPTKETVGAVGDIYTNLDDNVMYECIDIYPEDGVMVGKVPTTYTWRRLSNTETEFENRVGSGGSGSGAGGYKYFGIYVGTQALYKMDKFGVLNEPYKYNAPNVTRAEFEEAYSTTQIMLVPIDYNGKPTVEYATTGSSSIEYPHKAISYSVYAGTPKITYIQGMAQHEYTSIKFAAE